VRGVRFVVGRLRYSNDRAVHVVVFDSREFSERDARRWLLDHGFKSRVLQRDGRVWRSRERERAEFDPRSFRSIEPGRQEVVTMASNPKRRGKKRRAVKRRRSRARRRRKVSASSSTRTGLRVNARRARRRRRRRSGKTVRTDTRTVKVMRTNARKRRARPRRRSARSSTRYTLAFTPASLQAFARFARLSPARRREMRRAVRRHPTGGVYVALPAWYGSRETAKRVASRVQLLLAYVAGRRRASLTSSAAPRVVAVP
jgi:hypothetical protein